MTSPMQSHCAAARFTRSALTLILLAGTSTLPAQHNERALPDHEFQPIDGSDGRTKLSELYGHPVIVAGFKQNLVTGMHAAWVAKNLLADHADDGLIVVLEDQKAWTTDRLRASIRAFWMKFFASHPWITSNVGGNADLPIERKASKRDDMSLVLIGVDGRLVLEGTAENPADKQKPTDYRPAFERAVRDELRRRKVGWGANATERKVRATAFGKQNLADAWRVLEGAIATNPDEAFDELAAELDRAFAVRKKVVRHHFKQGEFGEAKGALSRLSKCVRGIAKYEAELVPLKELARSPETKAALRLEKKLARLLKLVHERRYAKFGPKGIAEVRAFAAASPNSPVAQRATRMDALLVHLVAFTKGLRPNVIEEKVAKAARK